MKKFSDFVRSIICEVKYSEFEYNPIVLLKKLREIKDSEKNIPLLVHFDKYLLHVRKQIDSISKNFNEEYKWCYEWLGEESEAILVLNLYNIQDKNINFLIKILERIEDESDVFFDGNIYIFTEGELILCIEEKN